MCFLFLNTSVSLDFHGTTDISDVITWWRREVIPSRANEESCLKHLKESLVIIFLFYNYVVHFRHHKIWPLFHFLINESHVLGENPNH